MGKTREKHIRQTLCRKSIVGALRIKRKNRDKIMQRTDESRIIRDLVWKRLNLFLNRDKNVVEKNAFSNHFIDKKQGEIIGIQIGAKRVGYTSRVKSLIADFSGIFQRYDIGFPDSNKVILTGSKLFRPKARSKKVSEWGGTLRLSRSE
jgi:hypothetical protein